MFHGFGIENIMEISKYDTLISILIGSILGIIPILLLCYINKRNINLFDFLNSIFKEKTTKILSFIIIIFLFYNLITITNDFINFANVKYLFETPNIFIAILFIFPIIHICHKGIETIGRTGIILFIISLVIFFINDFALLNLIDINNLKPILSSSAFNIMKGSIYYVIYMISPILFLSIVPKSDETYKNYNKALIYGYVTSTLSIMFITFYIMTIYNYEYISLFSYPAYFTLKKIKYGFIANVENILSFYFIIDYFMTITILLYSIFYFLNNCINLKKNKFKITSLFVTILLILLSVYLYKDTTIALIFSKKFYIVSNLILITLFASFTLKIKLHKN